MATRPFRSSTLIVINNDESSDEKEGRKTKRENMYDFIARECGAMTRPEQRESLKLRNANMAKELEQLGTLATL